VTLPICLKYEASQHHATILPTDCSHEISTVYISIKTGRETATSDFRESFEEGNKRKYKHTQNSLK
jgi:hypothetical protein